MPFNKLYFLLFKNSLVISLKFNFLRFSLPIKALDFFSETQENFKHVNYMSLSKNLRNLILSLLISLLVEVGESKHDFRTLFLKYSIYNVC